MTTEPTVVFLDRDGTIIRDVHYIANARDVELLGDAAHAIARLNGAGIPVIVITNQSGIARGRISDDDYVSTKNRTEALLAAAGAHVDATYYCPHHPDVTGPCRCRKPGTGMFERAAAERGLDMTSPVFIGDRWRDVEPFRVLGGTPILIGGPDTPEADIGLAETEGARVVASLSQAVDVLLGAQAP